jgi:hypothetical protein
MISGVRIATAECTMTSPRSCRPRSPSRLGKIHPVVARTAIVQVNNKIVFILSLDNGKASRFRTVPAVTDRCYIQNNSTIFVWIDCWSYITRRAGPLLWAITRNYF